MIQLNFIYAVSSFLFGISLLCTANSAFARLPFLSAASKSMISLNKNNFLGFLNTVPVSRSVEVRRTTISPWLVAFTSIFFPFSPTLANTMVNGNGEMIADEKLFTLFSSVSCSVNQCISSFAFFLAYDDAEFLQEVILNYGFPAISILIVKFLVDYSKNEFRSPEATMLKLQIGLDAQNWSDSDSKDMDKIKSDMRYPSLREFSTSISDATLKLLSRQGDWHSASLDSRIFRSFSSAEFDYHRLSLVEQSKLRAGCSEGTTSKSLVGDIPRPVGEWQQRQEKLQLLVGGSRSTATSSTSSFSSSSSSSFPSEMKTVVVTFVFLFRGQSATYRRGESDFTAAEVRESLLTLTAEVLQDRQRLAQAEILCSPGTLSEEDTLLLYPELWRL
eukprot:gene31861-41344_t